MSQTYTFNPRQLRNLAGPVRSLTVETGSIVVSKHEELSATTVETGDTFDAKGIGGLSVFSPESATVTVNFALEPAPAEPKVEAKAKAKAKPKAKSGSKKRKA